MRPLLLRSLLSTVLIAAGCGQIGGGGDSCDGVTCNGHGTCDDQGATPVCLCDPGYTGSGLTCIANPPAELTVPMTVHAWAGDGPAELVSNALPLRPGALADPGLLRVLNPSGVEVPVAVQVLTRWPQDSSVRALLIQLVAPLSGASAEYTVVTGNPRTTTDRTLVPMTWSLPSRLATFPAEYLSRSLVFWEQKPLGQTGYPDWDAKQLEEYDAIATVGTSECARYDHYYDAITTTFQLYARTGNPEHLANAHRWAIHHRSDQIYLTGPDTGHGICGSGYVLNTRYTFPQGLVSDYLMFGDPESLRVSALVADSFYMPHDEDYYYRAPGGRGFWTEREAAFSLIGLVAHYEATLNETYLDRVRDRVHSLHEMQADNGNRAWVHNLHDHDPSEGCPESAFGSSPWMSGLLLEGIITYHKLTQDPVARESILWALDDLRTEYLATGDHAGESFIYLGCTSVYQDGQPDLDNLISHAYAYGYRLSGYTRTDLRDLGIAIFETAVTEGFAGAHKQYDQQFRSSGHFVADIDPLWVAN